MSVTLAIIIAAAAIGGGVLISKSVKQAKINSEQQRIKDEENRARMASLRDRKEQKRQERLAREEQKKREKEALEEQRRLDEIKRQEEEKKRIEEYKKQLAEQDRALNRLGLTEVEHDYDNDDEEEEEYVEDYGYTSLEYQTNENLDIDKFFKYVSKYGLKDESFKIWVHASSGSSMYFAFNDDVNVSFARVGEGALKKFQSKKALRNFVWCFCQNEQIIEKSKRLATILAAGIDSAHNLQSKESNLEDYLAAILTKSDYAGLFEKQISVYCEKDIALVEYNLPAKDDLKWVKEYKYVASSNTIKEVPMAESVISKEYEQLLYSICLRSVYEVCVAKKADSIKSVVFNGFVTAINRANGIKERKCILSLQVSKDRFLAMDLKNVDPKKCF